MDEQKRQAEVTAWTQMGREKVRAGLAGSLLFILLVTIGLAFGLLAGGALNQAEIESLLDPIFPALVALTGSAIGFYFGGKLRD